MNKKKFVIALILSFLITLIILPNSMLAAGVPAVPANLTATALSSSTIELAWDAVDGATSYLIYMSVSSSSAYEKIASVKTASYTSTGLCASTKYYFKVKASNSSGSSVSYSSVASATTELPAEKPKTPANLKATAAGTDQIKLTWNAVTDAESYYVYRSTSSSGTYSKIATVKTTSYTNTGLGAGKKYYYKVAAYNRHGTSAQSATPASATTETVIPDVPTNLKAAALSSSQIKLTWDEVSDATSYYVYRAASSTGSYTKIATVTDDSYTNTGLTSNTTYYYKVQAHNSYGTSDYSAKAYATTKSGEFSADAENTYRLAGSDRYATAAKIAADGWESSNYAVIASGEDFPDALCGAPLAAKYHAPVLLTSRYKLEEQTRLQLIRLKVQDVFIIGGTGVISAPVEQAIEKLGINATRIAGKDRYETALQVAKKIGSFDQAIIANGNNFPDALSIASIAGIKGYPILLTEKNSLPTGLPAYLKSEADHTIVIGGTGVVSNNVFNQLPSPTRLSGDDRYGTNLAIIKYFAGGLDFSNCYAATGDNFPDTLAGSALAAMNRAPVFLVSNYVAQSMLDYMNDRNIEYITAFGGTGALSSTVLNKLAAKAGGKSNIPLAPTDLTANAVSSTKIFLDWDAVSNATGYYVYRADSSSGVYTKIATVKSSSSYTDFNLDADTTYYYKVKAYNSYGTSDFSVKVNETTD